MTEEEPQYRLRQYNHGAWCIEQRFVKGEKSKYAGLVEWKPIKYPGNLRQACERLLSLVIGLEVERDVIELKDALAQAEKAVTARIEEYVKT